MGRQMRPLLAVLFLIAGLSTISSARAETRILTFTIGPTGANSWNNNLGGPSPYGLGPQPILSGNVTIDGSKSEASAFVGLSFVTGSRTWTVADINPSSTFGSSPSAPGGPPLPPNSPFFSLALYSPNVPGFAFVHNNNYVDLSDGLGHEIWCNNCVTTTAVLTLPTTLASAPTNFLFPLSNPNDAYHLVTEIGGKSVDPSPPPYFDPFHTGGGYHSIDFASDASGGVIAGANGIVVRVDNTPTADQNFGPVVVIYNGGGYFTEYREFTTASVAVGEHVSAGETIGTYVRGMTGYGNGPSGYDNSALHFQVKYNSGLAGVSATNYGAYLAAEQQFITQYNASHSEPVFSAFAKALALSAEGIQQLHTITVAGIPMDRYRLFMSGGVPQPTAIHLNSSSTITVSAADLGAFHGINATVSQGVATLAQHSPAFFWNDIVVPEGAQYLSFEYLWDDKGEGAYLSVFFGDTLIANLLAEDFQGCGYKFIGNIPAFDFAGQAGQLLFALDSVGDPSSVIRLRNVAFLASLDSVPEPGTWLLMLTAFWVLGFYRRALLTRRAGAYAVDI